MSYATTLFLSVMSEWNMYTNTLPDMQRLLNQNGEKIQLAPRYFIFCYYAILR